MLLQNYLQKSCSLAKLSSLGDIRESNANEHFVSSLLDIACDSDSTADQIYIAALAMIAPSNPMVSVQGGALPTAPYPPHLPLTHAPSPSPIPESKFLSDNFPNHREIPLRIMVGILQMFVSYE